MQSHNTNATVNNFVIIQFIIIGKVKLLKQIGILYFESTCMIVHV